MSERYTVQRQHGEWCVMDAPEHSHVQVTIAVGCPIGQGGTGAGREYAQRIARAMNERDALLAACDEAHALLFHYDIARQPNGVDWGPVEMLRAEMIDKLWTALVLVKPELEQPSAVRAAGGK